MESKERFLQADCSLFRTGLEHANETWTKMVILLAESKKVLDDCRLYEVAWQDSSVILALLNFQYLKDLWNEVYFWVFDRLISVYRSSHIWYLFLISVQVLTQHLL